MAWLVCGLHEWPGWPAGCMNGLSSPIGLNVPAKLRTSDAGPGLGNLRRGLLGYSRPDPDLGPQARLQILVEVLV